VLDRKNSDSTPISSAQKYIEFCRIRQNCARIRRNSADSYSILLIPTEFCWFLQNSVDSYRILLIPTELCRIVQNYANSYRMLLQNPPEFWRIRWIMVIPTEFVRIMLIPTESDWILYNDIYRILTEFWLNSDWILTQSPNS